MGSKLAFLRRWLHSESLLRRSPLFERICTFETRPFYRAQYDTVLNKILVHLLDSPISRFQSRFYSQEDPKSIASNSANAKNTWRKKFRAFGEDCKAIREFLKMFGTVYVLIGGVVLSVFGCGVSYKMDIWGAWEKFSAMPKKFQAGATNTWKRITGVWGNRKAGEEPKKKWSEKARNAGSSMISRARSGWMWKQSSQDQAEERAESGNSSTQTTG